MAMKKAGKIALITVSSVVGAILIAVIVLCCVTVRPLKSFADYEEVRISTTTVTLPNVSEMTDKSYKNKVDKNLKKTGFSVMHAMLEFVYSYGPEFVTEKDDDGNTVNKAVTVSEAQAAAAATENSYLMEFKYGKLRTFKVKKSSIQYDRMLLNVHTTNGELQWVTLYLYDSSKTGGVNNPEHDDYRVYPVRVRMNTSPLYIALGEIAADFTA